MKSVLGYAGAGMLGVTVIVLGLHGWHAVIAIILLVFGIHLIIEAEK